MLKKSQISDNKLFTFIIISTIFSIILNVFLPDTYLMFFFSALVLFFGIIHGANDIHLIIKDKQQNKSIKSNTILYLISVILITTCFFSFPLASLIFFLLFSCYHFGEQQWTIFDNNTNSALFFFNFGLIVFSTLFFFNKDEVIDIVLLISDFSLSFLFFDWLLIISSILTITTLILNFNNLKNQLNYQFFLCLLILIVFSQLSLFYAFSVYFVFFHSIPSILEQTKYLYGNPNINTFKKYFISALPYWVFAILGLFLFYLFFSEKLEFSLEIFFSFLAAITFPHVIVIYKMKKTPI
ncbi:MAG: Brp/Blh family beta-carotene 15,15'-dioxygenase [Flavobacteriaceae bacterium]|nr:Brp/Blh family beta-carotene 15,15'-dioxygenase [Flavobacteriaceae bacterium]MBL6684003.1 Brp/Blh family beta-carotene 15,15'-dioxygenase [Flavobacteriaceae bacterium]